jgi:hypothetical protein
MLESNGLAVTPSLDHTIFDRVKVLALWCRKVRVMVLESNAYTSGQL